MKVKGMNMTTTTKSENRVSEQASKSLLMASSLGNPTSGSAWKQIEVEFVADFGWTFTQHRSSQAVKELAAEPRAESTSGVLIEVKNMNNNNNTVIEAQPAVNNNNPANSADSAANTNTPTSNPAIEITAASEFVLFKPSLARFPRLDGIFEATLTKIVVSDVARKPIKARKGARKAKASKSGRPAKPSAEKPAGKQLSVTFELTTKRADGASYVAVKEIRANDDQESRFGSFVKVILPEAQAQQQFFADWRVARLMGQKCQLKIKESRPNDQPVLKIIEVLPLEQQKPALDAAPVQDLDQHVTQSSVGQSNAAEPQAVAA